MSVSARVISPSLEPSYRIDPPRLPCHSILLLSFMTHGFLQSASPPACLCLSCIALSPPRPLAASWLSTLTFQRTFFLEAFDSVICSHLDFFHLPGCLWMLCFCLYCCPSDPLPNPPPLSFLSVSFSGPFLPDCGSRMDICDFGDLATSTFIWIGSKNLLFIKVMNKIRANISILKMDCS